jgi:hypothetical protein
MEVGVEVLHVPPVTENGLSVSNTDNDETVSCEFHARSTRGHRPDISCIQTPRVEGYEGSTYFLQGKTSRTSALESQQTEWLISSSLTF